MNAIEIKKLIQIHKQHAENLEGTGCNFDMCDGTPDNNRIVNMVTCQVCRSIIISRRTVKKLQSLLN